ILQHIIENFRHEKIMLLAPLVRGRKGHYRELFEQIRKQGYLKVRVDGELKELKEKMQVDRYSIHDIEVVVDRIEVIEKSFERLKKSLSLAMKMGKGLVMLMKVEQEVFDLSGKKKN